MKRDTDRGEKGISKGSDRRLLSGKGQEWRSFQWEGQ